MWSAHTDQQKVRLLLMPLIYLHLHISVNTVDTWTICELGIVTLCAVKNPCIIYSQPSVSLVSPYSRFLHDHDSASEDSTNHGFNQSHGVLYCGIDHWKKWMHAVQTLAQRVNCSYILTNRPNTICNQLTQCREMLVP